MKQLTEQVVINLMSEEWDKRVHRVLTLENPDVDMKKVINGKELDLVSSGLKVRHKASSLLYTVYSVGVRDVILQTPEGVKFIVDANTLEQEYQLD